MPSLSATVFVVEPDVSARVSLEAVLREEGGWTAEGFPCAEAFLDRPPFRQPSCLLMVLTLPDLAGFEVLRQVVADHAETPVIVLSGQHDVPSSVRAMKAGAVEVLEKPPADEVLLAAVEQAIALSRTVLEHEAELAALRERRDSLTGRERQVMERVVAGYLNKQIAAALGISEITVKAHRGRVMRKMEAGSLPELVTMVMTLGSPYAPSATTAAESREPGGSPGAARHSRRDWDLPIPSRASWHRVVSHV